MKCQRLAFPGRNFGIVWLALLALNVAAHGAEDAPLLRYAWQANQSYAYKVEVQASNADGKEILTGTPQFVVKSVSKDGVVVQLTGERLASRKEAPAGGIPNVRGPRGPSSSRVGFASGHELTLDLRGRVVKESGQSSIPYLLGDVPDLLLPKFPEAGEKTWKSSRELVIRVTQQGRIPTPFRDDVELKRMNAEETIEYVVKAFDEKTATLTRKYSLKTVETVDGEPAIEVSGEGTLVFDRVRGVPDSLEYAGKVVERKANTETKVPVTVSISRLSVEEQARLKAEREAKEALAKAPPTPQERAEILADLKSIDNVKWSRAVKLLAQKQPTEPDADIAALLAGQFSANDRTRRFQVAQALEQWATEKEVPLLLKTVDDEFQPTANAAMAALGRLKAAEAIEPLVKQLDKNTGKLAASKALKEIGPAAEAAVLKAVESNEWTVRLEAVAILSEIGSAKSLLALKSRAENDSNALIRQRAKDTLSKLEKLGADPKK